MIIAQVRQTLVNAYFPAVHQVRPQLTHQETQILVPPPPLQQQLLTPLLHWLPSNSTRQLRPTTTMQVAAPVVSQIPPTINSIFLQRPKHSESCLC